MESARIRSAGVVIPSFKKIRHVNASVATVMPEIGFDDEPISPVNRDDTVTNRNPKPSTRAAPKIEVQMETSVARNAANSANKTRLPKITVVSGMSRWCAADFHHRHERQKFRAIPLPPSERSSAACETC